MSPMAISASSRCAVIELPFVVPVVAPTFIIVRQALDVARSPAVFGRPSSLRQFFETLDRTVARGAFIVEEVPGFSKFLEEWAVPICALGFSVRAIMMDGSEWIEWPRPRFSVN